MLPSNSSEPAAWVRVAFSRLHRPGSTLVISLLLFGIALFAYWGALDNDFVWDSLRYVPGNPNIRQLNGESIVWAFTTTYFLNWHPITWLSYMLDYQLYGGYNPAGFHLTNILLHCVNVVLFYLLALRLFELHAARRGSEIGLDARIAALAAALILAIHPQHVESVAWVAERKDVLFLFFYLAAILAYLRYARCACWAWYLLTLLFGLLSMASKAMAVSLPVVLLLLDLYPLNRLRWQSRLTLFDHLKRYWVVLIEKTPLALVALFTAWVTIQAQSGTVNTFALTLLDRIGSAALSYLSYLSKMLFPVHFLPLYPRDPSLGFADHLPYVLAFLAVTLLCIHAWRNGARWWLIAWLFYGVTLLPVSGLVQVGDQVTADRYAYLPLLAAYVLIGGGIGRLFAKGDVRRRALLIGLVLMVSGGLLWKTKSQVGLWRHDLLLWPHVVAVYPDNPLVLGHIASLSYVHGDWEAALGYYEKLLDNRKLGVRLMPRYALLLLYEEKYTDAIKVYRWMAGVGDATGLSMDCIRYNISWVHAVRGDGERFEQTIGRLSNPEAFAELAAWVAKTEPGKVHDMPGPCKQDPYTEGLETLMDQRVFRVR